MNLLLQLKKFRLPRFSLRLRLSLSILAIVALFTLTNITYQVSGDNRNARLDNLQNAVQGQLSSVGIRQDLKRQQQEILVLDALRKSGEQGLSEEEIGNALRKLSDLSDEVSALGEFTYEESQPAYEKLSESFESLYNAWQFYYLEHNESGAKSIDGIESYYAVTIDNLAIVETLEVSAAEKLSSELQAYSRFADRVTLIIYLFAILLTVGLGFLLIRYTIRSLRTLQRGTERIGRGDLEHHIPVRGDDEIGDLTHAFNDMSDKLRNAMAQVQQSKEKADQANRAKTNFLANMSHELRTPLNAIIGYSEMNIDVFNEENALDQEQTISDLKHILSSGRHLLQLINDVLDLAKIESGNMTVFNESFSCVDMLKDISTTMLPLAKKNNNKLTVSAADNIPAIFTDSIKFRQVLLNLLSNACKFTHDGEIVVDVKHDSAANELIFEVRDSGVGMTKEQLENIFGAFIQADESTSKNYGGTGLGLAICKEFVELMKGSMEVSSAKDQGTKFIVRLPVSVQQRRSVDAIPTKNQQELDLVSTKSSNDSLAEIAASGESSQGVVALRCSKEITNTFYVSVLQSANLQILQLDELAKQLGKFESEPPKGVVIELCANNRKRYSQSWSEFLLLSSTANFQMTHFVLAYHQSSTEVFSKEHKHGERAVKLPTFSFYNDTVAQHLKNLFLYDDSTNLIQNLRKLNPVGRRGHVLLVGFVDENRQHWSERLQIELSAEAWQCSTIEESHAACDHLKEGNTDLLLLDIAINEQDSRKILDCWYQTIDTSKNQHIKAYIVSPDAESNGNQNRLLENPACEIVPILP